MKSLIEKPVRSALQEIVAGFSFCPLRSTAGRRLLKLSLISLFIHTYGYSQVDPKTYFQNFTVGSPNSFAFSKINNTQISPFSGQANLDFPIYEKQLQALPDFVMNLTYIAGGGLKFNTPRTIVGKTWMLNYGGLIIRNKRGVPDDYINTRVYGGSVPTKYNGILYNDGVEYQTDGDHQIAYIDKAFSYSEGIADAQHDIFEFNYFGKSGKFYIGKNGVIKIVTDSKIKIIPTYSTVIPEFKIESFLIVDESGIKYYFSTIELAKDGSLGQFDEQKTRYYGKEYGSAWLLTKVEAPFNEEVIQFDYLQNAQFSNAYAGYDGAFQKRSDQANGTMSGGGDVSFVKNLFPKSIVFSDGEKIEFEYFESLNGTNENLLLKKITVLNNDAEILKSLLFNYQQYETNSSLYSSAVPGLELFLYYSDKQFLREITLTNGAGSSKQALYAFDYFIGDSFNENTFASDFGIDFWGYYNGKVNQSTILYPTQYQTSLPDRNPDISFAKLGSLKTIVYPTGGSEEFEYELNEKRVGNQNVPIGGIRIKRRILHDGMDPAKDQIKEYRYVEADGSSSSGFLGEKPEFTFVYNVYQEIGWPNNPILKYTITTTFANPTNPLSSVEGNFVGYRRVEEIIQDATGSNIGKIVYNYTDLTGLVNWYPNDYYPYRPVDRPYWAVGLPKKISYYSNLGALVKETVNDYTIFEATEATDNYRSMQVVKKAEGDLFDAGEGVLRFMYKFQSYYPVVGRAELIATHEYTYSSTTPVTNTHALTQITYDPTYFFLRTTSTQNSKGENIVTKNFYSFDFAVTVPYGDPPHFTYKLKENNILNIPVMTETWQKNGTGSYLIKSEATEFKVLPNTIIRPSAIYAADLSNPLFSSNPDSFNPAIFLQTGRNYKAKFLFKDYDATGRLVQYEKEGGLNASVVLDKSGNVIAKGDNVPFNGLAYYGFEGSETGNWTFSSSDVTSLDAKIGTKSFKGTISKAALPADNYSVEFWAKGTGTVSVNGTNQSITSSWTFYKLLLSNVTSVSINTNGNFIDEVRLYRQEGNVAVYSYKNGVGISNAADINGEMTYYEYDELNRLLAVKDNSGNLVKSYQYHFKNPFKSAGKSGDYIRETCPQGYQPGPAVTYSVPGGKYLSILSQADADGQAACDVAVNGIYYANANGVCNFVYYNTAISAAFTKTNCPAGTVTFPVYYLVDAQKHNSIISQADADAKAQNDLTSNGQNYANTNGICRQLITVNVHNSTTATLQISVSPQGGNYTVSPGNASLSIPEGIYSVHIEDQSGTSHTYYIGQRSSIVGSSATFSNVDIRTNSLDNSFNATN